jgi:hypothetical protein
MTALLLLALATIPVGAPLVDRVDLIEIDHVYRCWCRPCFTTGRRARAATRSGPGGCSRTSVIGRFYDFGRRQWVMLFPDGGLLREVRAGSLREVWTQYDVERHERDFLPQDRRRGLLFERLPTP